MGCCAMEINKYQLFKFSFNVSVRSQEKARLELVLFVRCCMVLLRCLSSLSVSATLLRISLRSAQNSYQSALNN